MTQRIKASTAFAENLNLLPLPTSGGPLASTDTHIHMRVSPHIFKNNVKKYKLKQKIIATNHFKCACTLNVALEFLLLWDFPTELPKQKDHTGYLKWEKLQRQTRRTESTEYNIASTTLLVHGAWEHTKEWSVAVPREWHSKAGQRHSRERHLCLFFKRPDYWINSPQEIGIYPGTSDWGKGETKVCSSQKRNLSLWKRFHTVLTAPQPPCRRAWSPDISGSVVSRTTLWTGLRSGAHLLLPT